MEKTGFYIKELYRFKKGQDFFGLDVGNQLFFKMNKAVWDFIENFPHVENLDDCPTTGQLRDAVTALTRLHLIDTEPFAEPEIPSPKYFPLTGLGLYLKDPGSGLLMSRELSRQSIDLLVKESGESEQVSLVLIIEDFEDSLPVLEDILHYIGKLQDLHHKRITLALKTERFPPSYQLVEFADNNQLSMEIAYSKTPGNLRSRKKINNDWRRIITSKTSKILVSMKTIPKSSTALHQTLLSLYELGFKTFFLDISCHLCRRVPEGRFSSMERLSRVIKEEAFPLSSGNQREPMGFLNLFHTIAAIMSSTKIRYGCGAGISFLCVSPTGRLYPCPQLVGDPRLEMGSAVTGFDKEIRRQLIDRHVDSFSRCRSCGVRYLCGGVPAFAQDNCGFGGCKNYRQAAEEAMWVYHGLDLKKKSFVLSVSRRVMETLPDRCPLPVRTKPPRRRQYLNVRGSSMSPLFKEGDQVIVDPVEPDEVKLGDIVCYGKPITCHRVIWKALKNGRRHILEKGDHQIEGSWIPSSEISGKVVMIRKGKRTIELDTRRWAAANRLLALLSLGVYWSAGKVSRLRRERRKKWKKR